MKKVKTIHCKDGLNRQEELEARKLRRIFIDPSKKAEVDTIIKTILKNFYEQYGKNGVYEPLHAYIRKNNPVLSSAINRANFNLYEYIQNIDVYGK